MLKPIRPAAPIQAKYEARLFEALASMQRAIMREVESTWKRNEPETVIAADLIPAKALQQAIARMSRIWLRKFDTLSDAMADHFALSVRMRSDRALADMLRKGGMSVRFKMTAAMRDAYAAVRAENVGLIRSIAQQHLGKVETLVMQSVSQGGKLSDLSKALENNYGVTRRRAQLIARDQNAKATAVMVKTRHVELGITTAKWLHSAGGKHPRPEHVAFSGKTYDIRAGHDFHDGNGPVWPGTAINCRCVAIPVMPWDQ
jgi:SPP1 gp7 family putative phage head morphogenesis protein